MANHSRIILKSFKSVSNQFSFDISVAVMRNELGSKVALSTMENNDEDHVVEMNTITRSRMTIKMSEYILAFN